MRWGFFLVSTEKNHLLNNNTHMGIKDTSLNGYKLGKDSVGNNFSSLNHGVVEDVGKCKQDDGYNCDHFIF